MFVSSPLEIVFTSGT